MTSTVDVYVRWNGDDEPELLAGTTSASPERLAGKGWRAASFDEARALVEPEEHELDEEWQAAAERDRDRSTSPEAPSGATEEPPSP